MAIVAPTGVSVARATARLRSLTLADSSANILPETSISSDRVYFLDGDQQLRWLKPDGSTGVARDLRGSASQESAFSVSSDNSKIAVAEIELGPKRAYRYTLLVSALDGTNQKVVTQSSDNAWSSGVDWPVAWRGTSLLLQRGLLFNQYPYGYGSTQGFRVVNPESGAEAATICNNNQQVWSPPVAAGVVCDRTFDFAVVSLDGKTIYSSAQCAPWSPALAPDGSRWAGRPAAGGGGVCSNTAESIALYSLDGSSRSTGVSGSPWGWLDDRYLVVAHQTMVEVVSAPFRFVNVTNGSVIETQTLGRFIGVLPSGVT